MCRERFMKSFSYGDIIAWDSFAFSGYFLFIGNRIRIRDLPKRIFGDQVTENYNEADAITLRSRGQKRVMSVAISGSISRSWIKLGADMPNIDAL
jgi:hypothetical protein